MMTQQLPQRACCRDAVRAFAAKLEQRLNTIEGFISNDFLLEGWAGTEVIARSDMKKEIDATLARVLQQETT